MSSGTIQEPGRGTLPLPSAGFEADLVEAGRAGAAAELLLQLFQGEPPGLDAAGRQALAREILDLDLTAGQLLDELPWLDQFLDLVLSGDGALEYIPAATTP